MKLKQLLCISLLFIAAFSFAQNKNPFQSIGKKGEILTLTKGTYEELFDQDSIQQIGTTLINVRSMKIVSLGNDKNEDDVMTDNSRHTRFKSIDPLASSYPMLTPYQFASNSPISGIDLDGLEYYYAADGTLVAKFGTSTQVKVVNDKFIKENSGKKVAVKDLNNSSRDVGLTNEELNTRAFLSTIKQTENGGRESLDYNSANGFTRGKVNTFTSKSYYEAPEDYADHPGFLNGSKSSAAGAYQILGSSFKAYKKQNKEITDFSPASQDKIAMLMFKYRKATDDIANGDLSEASRKLTTRKGGEQFASLPGGSQSNLTIEDLRIIFKGNVSNELNDKSNIAIPKGELTNFK